MSRQVKKVNISGKEDKSNKVSSWSNTTTDTHYPSEKLVKDSLDGKASSTHTHSQYLTEHQDLSNYVTTDDSRLSDARTPTSHTHTKSQITDFPTLPSASSTVPSADTTNGSYGSGTSYARSNHTHPKSNIYAGAIHTHTNVFSTSDDGDVYIYTNGTSQPPTSLGALLYNMDSEIDGKSDANHTHSGYASSSHTHGTWTSQTVATYGTLYINTAIRMCELRYVRSFSSASADTFYEWHTGAIPSGYRPSSQVMGSINQVGAIYVDSNGNIGGKFAIGWSSSRSVIGTVMWHY